MKSGGVTLVLVGGLLMCGEVRGAMDWERLERILWSELKISSPPIADEPLLEMLPAPVLGAGFEGCGTEPVLFVLDRARDRLVWRWRPGEKDKWRTDMIEGLPKLRGIALHAPADVWISLGGIDPRIVRYRWQTGTLSEVGRFGGGGDGEGKFWDPWGLAADRCGNLIIADTRNDRIQRLTGSGASRDTFVVSDPCWPTNWLKVPHPLAVAIDPRNGSEIVGVDVVGRSGAVAGVHVMSGAIRQLFTFQDNGTIRFQGWFTSEFAPSSIAADPWRFVAAVDGVRGIGAVFDEDLGLVEPIQGVSGRLLATGAEADGRLSLWTDDGKHLVRWAAPRWIGIGAESATMPTCSESASTWVSVSTTQGGLRGIRRCEGSVESGSRVGRWTEWLSNGNQEVGQYRGAVREGLWKITRADGSRVGEGSYLGGKKQGRWLSWSVSGTLISQGDYAEDEPNGEWTWWADNGRKSREGRYERGLMVGPWKLWDVRGRSLATWPDISRVPSADRTTDVRGMVVAEHPEDRYTLLTMLCGDGGNDRQEFIRREEDAQFRKYYNHFRGISAELGHKRRMILVHDYGCSDCHSLRLVDLVSGRQIDPTADPIRRWSRTSGGVGYGGIWGGAAFSPDDRFLLVPVGEGGRSASDNGLHWYSVDAATGLVVRDGPWPAPKEWWQRSTGKIPGAEAQQDPR